MHISEAATHSVPIMTDYITLQYITVGKYTYLPQIQRLLRLNLYFHYHLHFTLSHTPHPHLITRASLAESTYQPSSRGMLSSPKPFSFPPSPANTFIFHACVCILIWLWHEYYAHSLSMAPLNMPRLRTAADSVKGVRFSGDGCAIIRVSWWWERTDK